MLVRVACSIAIATSVAGAAPPELELGAQHLELDPRRDALDDSAAGNALPWVRSAGFAQLTGGGRTGGDAGVGASAALGGLGCDLAAASVQGRLRPFAGNTGGHAVGEVSYAVCPLAAFLTVAWIGRRGAGLMPALDARRSLWNRAYTEEHDLVRIGFGPYWSGDASTRHTLFLVEMGHGVTTQQDGSEVRSIKSLDTDFTVYRAVRPDGITFDVLALTQSAMKSGTDDRGGIATSLLPARARYESPDSPIFVAGSAGWGFTGGHVTASSSVEVNDKPVTSWTETIDGSGLPQMSRFVGDLEAGVRLERWSGSARIARAFFPTFDGNLARESRISGSVTYVAGRTRRTSIAFAPFVARTRTWVRGEGSAIEPTAGASLHVGRELTDRLHVAQRTTTLRLDAIGEAGVSPYARPGADRLPSSALGGQILLAISGSVRSLQPDVLR